MYNNDFYTRYAAFIKKMVKKYQLDNVRLLDIACGTGRLIKALQSNKAASKIEGIDNSAHMLVIARKRNREITFHNQDMTELRTNTMYDVITCTFDSVNYLTDLKQLKKFFTNTIDHLNNDGLLIFDFNTIHKKPMGEIHKGNITLQDIVSGRYWNISISSSQRHQRIFQEEHRERLYSLRQIKMILTVCHCHVKEIYSGFNNRVQSADNHERLIVVAQHKK